jgi:hypothetical protein
MTAAIQSSSTVSTAVHNGTPSFTFDQNGIRSGIATLLRGYIDGLTMSTAGSSTTMTIAPGEATDSTNLVTLELAASINKTTASWAVGTATGGLDTGSIANSTWYYFYVIRRPDTGVVDVVFSTNSTSPTLPTNYTQFRYIGAGLTNGSGQWTRFFQTGDEFWWETPVIDFNAGASTTGALATMSVPRGRKMKILCQASLDTSGTVQAYLSDPSAANLAPSTTVAPYFNAGAFAVTPQTSLQLQIWTNTSAQIRQRATSTSQLIIVTNGWTDLRGRNA